MPDRGRALIVDEAAASRGRLAAVLGHEGYAVAAVTAAEALPALARRPADLILIGLSVSAADARAFAAAYHRGPDPHAPILLISARAEPAVRVAAGAMGAAGYLARTVEPAAVLAAAVRLTRMAPLPAADDPDEVGSRRYLHRLAREVDARRADAARVEAAARALQAAARSRTVTLWDVARRRALLCERAQLRLELEHYLREHAARRARPTGKGPGPETPPRRSGQRPATPHPPAF